MNRIYLFLLFSITLTAYSQIKYEKYLFIRGTDTIPYKLMRPEKKFSEKKLPLIIFFHGAGERGNDNERQTLLGIDKLFADSVTRNNFPCYVIAPQCPRDKKWADMDWTKIIHEQTTKATPPMSLTHKLADSLKKILNIDTTKIYVTGLSMGGFGTWDYCARYPGEVAAAVPVCGGYDVKAVGKMKAIPFWVFHGDADKLVKIENARQMVDALKKLKANVKYSELPGLGHGAWTEAYKDDSILKWMFQFSTNSKKKK